MAFNRYVDARIDEKNPRTATRHIPSGQLSARSVLAFTIVHGPGIHRFVRFVLAELDSIVGSIPVPRLDLRYSFAKRFTSAAHLWLGVALALTRFVRGLLFESERDSESDRRHAAIFLAAAIATWVAGFDIIYACQDADFDKRAAYIAFLRGLVCQGIANREVLHAVHAGCLGGTSILVSPAWSELDLLYCLDHCVQFGSPSASVGQPVRPQRVNLAFFNVNAVISLGSLRQRLLMHSSELSCCSCARSHCRLFCRSCVGNRFKLSLLSSFLSRSQTSGNGSLGTNSRTVSEWWSTSKWTRSDGPSTADLCDSEW